MVGIDANEGTICVVLIGQGKSQCIGRKMKPGLPCSGQLGWVNKQGIMMEAEFSLRFFLEFARSPCEQMAPRLLFFIKFGPSVDHGESISANKFFLGILTK